VPELMSLAGRRFESYMAQMEVPNA
jgi:hypothetical protein